VRAREAVGHVTTGEYGSQMLARRRIICRWLRRGRVTCDTLMDLSNCKRSADHRRWRHCGGAGRLRADVNGVAEERMRSLWPATIGMFAKQWHGKVDEVVVVDDHITGVLSDIRPESCSIFPIPGSR
jgi:hypothetical protein